MKFKKYKRKDRKFRFRLPGIWMMFWLVLILFVGLQVFSAVQTLASGGEIAELEKKEAELLKANRELQEDLVKSSSLSQMSEEADELGFTEPDTIIYLGTDDFVAKLP